MLLCVPGDADLFREDLRAAALWEEHLWRELSCDDLVELYNCTT